MLQRIQTVYLLLSFAACLVCLCTCIGHFYTVDGDPVADLYNLWLVNTDGQHSFQPWALFALLAFTATIIFIDIFLYARRAFQMRVIVFGIILLVGWYLVYGVFAYMIDSDLGVHFRPHWTAAFPATAIVLLYLAFRGILKDELLVKSLDRLR